MQRKEDMNGIFRLALLAKHILLTFETELIIEDGCPSSNIINILLNILPGHLYIQNEIFFTSFVSVILTMSHIVLFDLRGKYWAELNFKGLHSGC